MPLPKEPHYTYANLLAWEDNTRYELFDGTPVALASPSQEHQRILTALLLQLAAYLEDKPCQVYPAPFDVRLFAAKDQPPETIDTVVQPDLLVVCDPEKVDRQGVHGAPDLVLEILSPSTRRSDRLTKHLLYQRAGVREYWIVDPATRSVAVHLLEAQHYASPDFYTEGAVVPVSVLAGFSIDLSRVFPH